ncbi:hypothetical protein [Kribbella soli]|uniref:hypothetical protein n=1 Tax=Kribbella soli TaxID=1124743 RepID=UPI0013F448EC|nr:hypothetical protein [Kribbella soli]
MRLKAALKASAVPEPPAVASRTASGPTTGVQQALGRPARSFETFAADAHWV